MKPISAQKENVVVVCADNSVASLIQSILSSFETYHIEIRNFHDFSGDHSLSDPNCTVIIDESMNVKESLTLNRLVRNDYPDVKLIALSSYRKGDFGDPFINSGANYVLSFTNLHSKLSEICKSTFTETEKTKKSSY